MKTSQNNQNLVYIRWNYYWCSRSSQYLGARYLIDCQFQLPQMTDTAFEDRNIVLFFALLLHSALYDINHDMVLLKVNVSIIKSRQACIHGSLTSRIKVQWLNDQREQRRIDRQLLLWQNLMILSGEFEMMVRVVEFCSSNMVWDYV